MRLQHVRDFEQTFRFEGGFLHVSRVHPSAAREIYGIALRIVRSCVADFWRKNQLSEAIPLPGVCYIGSTAPNGYAKMNGGRFYTAVTAALVDNMAWWAHTLLAHPQIFPDLGRPGEEMINRSPPCSRKNIIQNSAADETPTLAEVASAKSVDELYHSFRSEFAVPFSQLRWDNLNDVLSDPDPPSPRKYESSDFSHGFVEYERRTDNYVHYGWQVPLCSQRRAFAAFITCAAVCQALLHELSHAFCGHLDFPQRLEKATRENDADLLALECTIAFHVLDRLGEHFPLVDKLVAGGIQKADLPTYLWALGIVILHYQNLPWTAIPRFAANRDYHSPIARVLLHLYHLEDIQKDFPKVHTEPYSQGIGAASRTVQDVWRSWKIPGFQLLPSRFEENEAILRKAVDEMKEAIHRNFPTLKLLNAFPTRTMLGDGVDRILRHYEHS